jgi:hypothetical protein
MIAFLKAMLAGLVADTPELPVEYSLLEMIYHEDKA